MTMNVGYDIVVGTDPTPPSAHHHHVWFTVIDLATGQPRPWTYLGIITFDQIPDAIKAKAIEQGLEASSWRDGFIAHSRVD